MTNRTHGMMMTAVGIAVAGVLVLAAPPDRRAPAKTKWTAETVLPFTCAQAWVESGKTYSGMLSIVAAQARISLANRVLTFPNTREAGLEAGKSIASDCKADPNGLLFAIVDKHVRRIGEADAGADK